VLDKFSWEDIKSIYVQEAFRRNVLHVPHVILPAIETVDDLMDTWMKLTNSGRVTMFNVFFMNTIARPKGKTIQEIKDAYDITWGKLPDRLLEELKKGIESILSVKKLPQVMKYFGLEMEDEGIAELILWSFDNKLEGSVKYGQFPLTGGIRVNVWKQRVKLWKQIHTNPVPLLQFLPPPTPNQRRYAPYAPTSRCLRQLSQKDELSMELDAEVTTVNCDCKRCRHEVKLQQERQNWIPYKNNPRMLFVARLDYKTEEKAIQERLTSYGDIRNINIIRDKSNASRGYAIVEFDSQESVTSAIEGTKRNPLIIDGKNVLLDVVRAGLDKKFYPRKWGGGVGPGRR
jgi:hypothetical protein